MNPRNPRLIFRPRRHNPAHAPVQQMTLVPVPGAAPLAMGTEVVLGFHEGRAISLDLAGVPIGVIYRLQTAIIDAVRASEAEQMARAR